MTPADLATIVVVPRERFSEALASLRSLLETTGPERHLVYVDGGSPEPVRSEIAALAETEGFDLVRTEHYLSPNVARNLGLARVMTPYVVFVDNDVRATPGWLDALVDCAEATGAWVVGPLLYEGSTTETAHNAGGDLRFEGPEGARELVVDSPYGHRPVGDLAADDNLRQVGYVEFHCVLVRRAAFDAIGPLDEELRSTREHLDLCLQVAAAGGEIWCTNRSRVHFVNPPPVTRSDLAYFELRWSERWNRASLDHFAAKYGLSDNYRRRKGDDARRRRYAVLDRPLSWAARRADGRGHRVALWVVGPLERLVNELAGPLIERRRPGRRGAQ